MLGEVDIPHCAQEDLKHINVDEYDEKHWYPAYEKVCFAIDKAILDLTLRSRKILYQNGSNRLDAKFYTLIKSSIFKEESFPLVDIADIETELRAKMMNLKIESQRHKPQAQADDNSDGQNPEPILLSSLMRRKPEEDKLSPAKEQPTQKRKTRSPSRRASMSGEH